MWTKKPEDAEDTPSTHRATTPAPRAAPPARPSASTAVIGPSIAVDGTISGEEDLIIQGRVDGKVELPRQHVTVGAEGQVNADVYGRIIDVEGKVEGNLYGEERVVVRSSGSARGNITAPRVSLEDGANFKGAIDMDSARPPAAGAARPKPSAGGGAAKPPGAGPGPRGEGAKDRAKGGAKGSSPAPGSGAKSGAG